MLCEYGLGGRQDFAQAIQMYTQAASGVGVLRYRRGLRSYYAELNQRLHTM